MSQVRDFEVTEAGKEALQIYSFLCYLPFGSAAASAAIISDRLEGPTFRNALRLLREEIRLNACRLDEGAAKTVRINVAMLDLDSTRSGLISDILDYLTGCVKAFFRIGDWLAAEAIVPESFTHNLKTFKSA